MRSWWRCKTRWSRCPSTSKKCTKSRNCRQLKFSSYKRAWVRIKPIIGWIRWQECCLQRKRRRIGTTLKIILWIKERRSTKAHHIIRAIGMLLIIERKNSKGSPRKQAKCKAFWDLVRSKMILIITLVNTFQTRTNEVDIPKNVVNWCISCSVYWWKR